VRNLGGADAMLGFERVETGCDGRRAYPHERKE
jgi:hypothetical protein